MKLKIGISPCPNDTYIFDAICNQLIACEPFEFDFIFEDVETLNQMALDGSCDVLKLSYAHYFNVLEEYCMLESGSALGFGVGPLLISKQPIPLNQLSKTTIAIPGQRTTANFLLHFAFPELHNLKSMPFQQIEQVVQNEQVDAGVIIHENRFTYESKGLIKLMDLGEYWEIKTKLPIPLGGIAIRRGLSTEIQKKINNLVQKSISYSRQKKEISDFVKCHAQEMDEAVMKHHIDLYVNENTMQIDELGIKAVSKMQTLLRPDNTLPLFIA